MDILTYENLPERIEDEEALEELLSRPSEALIDDLARVEGDVLILGVGGKTGPSLARMVRRAAADKEVVGVSRFNDHRLREQLEDWGVKTIPCNLLRREAVERLPRFPNVICLAGRKFGTTGDPAFSWAVNTYLPGLVAETFRDSRIVAFSSLCVYPFAPVTGGGWSEDDPPGPVGEYANGCVGRERVYEYFSALHGTQGRLIRLNYQVDPRHGVLFDVANWVWRGQPVPLAMGHANVIWRGDANAQVLRSLAWCTAPATPLNIGGPGAVSIRGLALEFGRRFGIEPVFEGAEAPDAWINSTAQAQHLFGYPVVPLARMVDWVADWVERGMTHHGRPTRFEVRDGQF